MGRKFLLLCGISSSLLYIAMNIFIPMQFEGYNIASQTVSELSAIDTPTRALWVFLALVYSFLLASFGFGVWKSAAGNRLLHVTAALIITYAVIGAFWPPMHQREIIAAGGGTLTDTMHIVFTVITGPIMLIAIGFAAVALRKWFRVYSILTIIVMLLFGVLTAADAPGLESNQPTPWMGVWERICIGAQMVWIIVLAAVLLDRKTNDKATPRNRESHATAFRGINKIKEYN